MNKKIIAAAIAAAVVSAPAAFAESVVYGKIHTSIDSFDRDASSGSISISDRDAYEVNNRSSRLGFKGSEDLGNGLKAIYQIEFGIRSDGGVAQNAGDGHTTQRNTFVGLAGDWGTVLVGRHDTPAKMAFYAAGNERLGDSILDLNPGGNNPIGVFTEHRLNNAIIYVSPDFSGFTLAAGVFPGEESGTNGSGHGNARFNADGIADSASVGLMYKGFGLKASVAYEETEHQIYHSAGDNPGQNQEMWQAGASYTFNNLGFGVQYETDENYESVNNQDYEAWGVTATATFGNNAISAVYTMSETELPGSPERETDGWGLSGEHNFSKRTKAYVAYANSSTEITGQPDSDQDVFSLGMIHNF